MVAVIVVPTAARAGARAALVGGLICAAAACGTGTPAASGSAGGDAARGAAAQSHVPWQEPGSYTYTLLSSRGERSLLGTFRITVRDGAVVDAVGLDDSGRSVAERVPDAVPTLGELLAELDRARRDGADEAQARYAADGHPVRISLDWEEDAIDDEALYVISDYARTKD
ncbi:DUF6174 domain-containing protein [Streptomyces sp. NPDC007808]|uniref:DUF6174 domain-containing protein n=1 Tax=Streptomyces sp. NPDC007808 TaxID=3364779 RepID=UPI0036831696